MSAASPASTSARRRSRSPWTAARLTYAADELDQLAIAYAVTVHKAQGSEYPAVVLPLLRQHGRMLRRNLLYTAITRARKLVVLLTEPEALERAVRDTSDLRRIDASSPSPQRPGNDRHEPRRNSTPGSTAATPIVRAAGALALDYFRDRATPGDRAQGPAGPGQHRRPRRSRS